MFSTQIKNINVNIMHKNSVLVCFNNNGTKKIFINNRERSTRTSNILCLQVTSVNLNNLKNNIMNLASIEMVTLEVRFFFSK